MRNRPLVALSSAAILAVYTAGYFRTRAAAERFDHPPETRRQDRTPAPRTTEMPLVEGRVAIDAPSPAPAVVPRAAIVSKTPAAARIDEAAAPATRIDETPSAASTDSSPGQPTDTFVAPGIDEQTVQGLEPPTADAPPPAVPGGPYKDGTYTGWGSCQHGDLEASVVIEGGRMVSASVRQCLTRYSCAWIRPLYPKVVAHQNQNGEADYVTGATESSDAFHDAVAEALAKAR